MVNDTLFYDCFPYRTRVREQVGFGLDPEEQGHYLHLLDTWKGHDGKKDCVIVAGDLHYAIHTVIQVSLLLRHWRWVSRYLA